MNKDIVYFMHIPWNWVKQRPQFLAEELSQYFSVKVVYQKSYISTGLIQKKSKNQKLNFFEFLAIPFKTRLKLLWFNIHFVRMQLKLFNIIKPSSIIWLTHPELYQYISSSNLKNPIIYDCMDDILEFPSVKRNSAFSNKLFLLENKLCHHSNIIFCSSNYLKDKLIHRYHIHTDKIKVINNGVNLTNLMIQKKISNSINKFFYNGTKKIVYIGTISEWFDFDLIFHSLKKISDIEYLLFGITEVLIPHHDKITYCGPIEHEYVSSIMEMADILVMPFKINELIKGVNPVKAYEYIFSSKPALIVEYEETQKFVNYLYLYKSKDDYVNQLLKIINKESEKVFSQEEKEKFVLSSEWTNRAKEINDTISYKI